MNLMDTLAPSTVKPATGRRIDSLGLSRREKKPRRSDKQRLEDARLNQAVWRAAHPAELRRQNRITTIRKAIAAIRVKLPLLLAELEELEKK